MREYPNIAPATSNSIAARIAVGTKIMRELALRLSAGNRFAAVASRGQAPASEAAYGIVLREKSKSAFMLTGGGRIRSRRAATVSGGNRSSAAARAAARSAGRSNCAENTGRDGLSP